MRGFGSAAGVAGLAVLLAGLAPGDGRAPNGAAQAASFDCARAASATDIAICSDATLSGLDTQLGLAYGQRLAIDPSARQVERAWLAARNVGCGRDVGCLRRFTAAQLSWLRSGGRLTSRRPTIPGTCGLSAISELGSRLEGDPASGSAAAEANGADQVSYDVIPAIQRSRVGDPALVCLVSLPQDCPPGDDRGRIYAVGNLRTLGAWSEADAEHMCGGA